MAGERMFPIQPASRRYAGAAAPLTVPWSVAEKAYAAYASRYGTSQSMERMAERGGFAVQEMDELHPAWREEASDVTALRAQAAALAGALRGLRLHAPWVNGDDCWCAADYMPEADGHGGYIHEDQCTAARKVLDAYDTTTDAARARRGSAGEG